MPATLERDTTVSSSSLHIPVESQVVLTAHLGSHSGTCILRPLLACLLAALLLSSIDDQLLLHLDYHHHDR